MKIKILKLLFLSLLTMMIANHSYAGVCTSGAPDFATGSDGMIKFVNSDMMYCNGTDWVSLKPDGATTSGPCSQQGRIDGEFFCDGINLYSIVATVAPDQTTNAPISVSANNGISFFNGSMNIKSNGVWKLAGSCVNNCSGTSISLLCTGKKQAQCTATVGCYWTDPASLVGPWGCNEDGYSTEPVILDGI